MPLCSLLSSKFYRPKVNTIQFKGIHVNCESKGFESKQGQECKHHGNQLALHTSTLSLKYSSLDVP